MRRQRSPFKEDRVPNGIYCKEHGPHVVFHNRNALSAPGRGCWPAHSHIHSRFSVSAARRREGCRWLLPSDSIPTLSIRSYCLHSLCPMGTTYRPWSGGYDEEKVFWRGYCEIESSKSQQKQRLKTLKIIKELFRPFVDGELSEEEKNFRVYFAGKTSSISLFVLTVDFVFISLLTMRTVLRRSAGLENSVIQDSAGWNLMNVPWAVLICLCLLFYCDHLGNRGRVIRHMFSCEIVEALDGLGMCILMARLLMLALTIRKVLTLGLHTCIDSGMMTDSTYGFGFIAAKILMSMVHMGCISLLPIKRSHLALLSAVESLTQALRLVSCAHLLQLDPGHTTWARSLCGPLLAFYVMCVVVPSVTLEQSIKASYRHLMELKSAAQEKKQLVNMFCSDLKVPIQKTKQLLNDLSLVHLTTAQSDTLDRCISALTMVTDQVLFSIRVHEGRFKYSFQDTIQLTGLVAEALNTVRTIHNVKPESIKIDVIPAEIHSSRLCLLTLLHFATTLAIIRCSFWSPQSSDASIPEAGLVELVLNVKSQGVNKPSLLEGAIRGKLAPSQEAPAAAKAARDKYASYHNQSCVMFCQNIVSACGGTFHFECQGERGISVRFAIPCWNNSVIPGLSAEVSPCSSPSPSRRHSTSPVPSGGIEEVNMPTLHAAALSEICLYSPDPSLSDLALNALQPICGVAQVSIPAFDRLNMADMRIHSVVVVTSLVSCKELRARGYDDRIVLMTDRLAYLDDKDIMFDKTRMLYDHAVSMPCNPSHLRALCQWLNRVATVENATLRRRRSSVGIRGFRGSMHASLERVRRWGVVPHIEPSQMLNYLRWRLLNPSGSIFHHTNSIDVMITCSGAVLIAAFVMEGSRRITTVAVLLPLYGILLMRRVDVKTLAAMGWKFHNGLIVLNYLELLPCLVQIYILMVNATNKNYFLPHPRVHPTDPDEFLDTSFANNASGKHLIFAVCIFITTSKFLAEVFVWPYSLIVCAEQLFYTVQIIVLYWADIIPNNFVHYGAGIVTLGGLFVMGVLTYIETLRRTEFSELRKLILSRDFLERCISASWRDTKVPLTALIAVQEAMVQGIHAQLSGSQRATKDARGGLVVQPRLQGYMEKVSFHIALSRGLLYEMQMSLKSFVARAPSVLAATMESYLLKPIIRRVLSLFVRNDPSRTIRVNLHVHPSVMYVRIDKMMLEVMLFTACRDAVRRIHDSVRSGVGDKGITNSAGLCHEVLISFRPRPGQEALKFSDLRMMDMVVMDTADSVRGQASQQMTRYQYLQHAYERYMERHGQRPGSFNSAMVDEGHYRSCQLIALPHKLCPASPKIASLMQSDRQELMESIDKQHRRYLNEHQLLLQQSCDMHQAQAMPNRRVRAVDCLPTRLLTILSAKNADGSKVWHEIARYSDCYDNGWDRKLVYLHSQMPEVSVIKESCCIVIDHALCTVNRDTNRRYLQDLLLYMRALDFHGVLALVTHPGESSRRNCGESCVRCKQRPMTTPAAGSPRPDSQAVSDPQFEQQAFSSALFQEVDVVDVELSAPLRRTELLQLRELTDLRLLHLTLPLI